MAAEIPTTQWAQVVEKSGGRTSTFLSIQLYNELQSQLPLFAS
jgi:hypothetical protein